MRLAMRWVENEMSMKLVAWGMKTWPLGMKYHDQGYKILVLSMKWKHSMKQKKFSQGKKFLYRGMKKVFKVWKKI